MDLKEFSEETGKILGIKSSNVELANICMRTNDHLNQMVNLRIRPNKYQAKKLRDLVYKFGQVKPLPNKLGDKDAK